MLKEQTMKKSTLSVLAAAMLLAGCTGSDTGLSKTTTGALIGGVVGAGIGAATGKNKGQRALVGGAIGALAGAGVGAYMDHQEEELNKELEGSSVSVTRNGDTLNLNMPGNVTFDSGKASITTGFNPVLDDIAKVMNKYPETLIEVQGHTDNIGSDADNYRLSEFRAKNVGSALATRGVAASRIKTVGFGESTPIADNSTPAGREANRRVEIKIIPNPSN